MATARHLLNGTTPSNAKRLSIRYIAGAAATGAVVSGAALFGLASYLVRRVTVPRRPRRPAAYRYTPWEFGIPHTTVRIPLDGGEIDAWFLAQDDRSRPVIIVLSGHNGNKSELLGVSSALFRDGFSCVLFDYRGTGQSTGNVITLGHNETDDARAVLDRTVEEFPGAPIGIIGYSMGGSVAINLASRDDRIGAVVADSAFATQYSVLAHHVHRFTRLRPEPILATAAPMFRRKHQKGYDDFAPADVVHQISPRPLLIIHPGDDIMVPMSEAMQLWENAREPKELWIVEGVGHCGAYFEDREAGDIANQQRIFEQNALTSFKSRTTLVPAFANTIGPGLFLAADHLDREAVEPSRRGPSVELAVEPVLGPVARALEQHRGGAVRDRAAEMYTSPVKGEELGLAGSGEFVHGGVAGAVVEGEPEPPLGDEERHEVAVRPDRGEEVGVVADGDPGAELADQLRPQEGQGSHSEEAEEGHEGRGPGAVQELPSRDRELVRSQRLALSLGDLLDLDVAALLGSLGRLDGGPGRGPPARGPPPPHPPGGGAPRRRSPAAAAPA
jgi:uncharacterized protein